MPTATKILMFYTLFVFFLIFLVSLGIEIFAEEFNLVIPEFPEPTENVISDLVNTLGFFIESVGFYVDLATVTPEISMISTIILTPIFIILIYIFLTTLFIPFLEAIGSLIPFT